MKNLFLMATMVVAMVLSACGGQQMVVQNNTSNKSGNPFGETYEMPAAEYDTDDSFGATGISSGPKMRMDVIQKASLANAQELVRQKMKHAYKSMLSNYSNYIGTNAGADAERKMEDGGDQIIDVIVNDTKATKVVWSAVDDKGNITCYTGIRVDKKVMADAISDFVSEDEELKIRFKEELFRKKMNEALKNYKENK